jgi:hypothetical protein
MIKEGFDKLFSLKEGIESKTPVWGDWIQTGYAWAPYIITSDPITTSYDSWQEWYTQAIQTRRDIRTRYATRIINNSYYGTLTVNPCNEIFLGGEDMCYNSTFTFTMDRWGVEKDSLGITKYLKKFDF